MFIKATKGAAELSRSRKSALRTLRLEPSKPRKSGPKAKRYDSLSKSGQKHRKRAHAKIHTIIIGAGWGHCGSMNLASNLVQQGHTVMHEVDLKQ